MKLRLALVALPWLLAGCGGGGGGGTVTPPGDPPPVDTPKSALALSRFADCDQYRSYYREALTKDYLTGFWGGIRCWSCPQPLAVAGAPSAAAEGFPTGAPADGGATGGPGATPSPSLDFSATNTQEPGVDEADIIEADAASGRIYTIPAYNELLTLNADPPQAAQIASRVTLDGPFFSGLYLDAPRHKLVTVGGGYRAVIFEGPATPVADFGGAILDFYDLADPDHPRLVDRYEIAGQPIDSRRIGRRIHLVSNFPLWPPRELAQDQAFADLLYQEYFPALQRGDQAEVDRLAAQIRTRVASSVSSAGLDEILPSWRHGLGNAPAQTLACTDVLRPQVPERLGLIVVSSIDTDGGGLAQTAAINNAWTVYASTDHLFLAQTSGGWWFDPQQNQQTALYRFTLPASGAAQPAGSGVIDGWVENSHNLSEHEGFLRAVVGEQTLAADQRVARTNHLFVLGNDGADLSVVGALRDFKRDEALFAVRFLGDRAFAVTFHQIDPLFAFDLSDPHAPRLAGELEVPGFSTYLYPFGDDRLVGIGREAGIDGRLTGKLQLSMFDVGDLAHPAVIDRRTLGSDQGWAFSVAEYDPHAFTLSGNVLSVPVQIGAQDQAQAFSGFVAYRVARAGFTELARIDHKQDPPSGGDGCPSAPPPPTGAPAGGGSSGGGTTGPGGSTGGGSTDQPPCETFAPVQFNQPLRSVIGNDGTRTVLFTLSDAFLKAADVTSTPATELSSVPLRASP